MITVASINGSGGSRQSIADGIHKHGDKFIFNAEINSVEANTADAYIQKNMLKAKYATQSRSGPYEYIIDSNKPFLVLESANFRKWYLEYNRLGWYSYKWTDGIFLNKKSEIRALCCKRVFLRIFYRFLFS